MHGKCAKGGVRAGGAWQKCIARRAVNAWGSGSAVVAVLLLCYVI